jgi:hypothetical protein
MMCRWQFQVAIGDSAPKLFRLALAEKLVTNSSPNLDVVPLDLALGRPAGMTAPAAPAPGEGGESGTCQILPFSPAYANTEGGAAAASDVASRTLSLRAKIERPAVFYVRLLNPGHAKFKIVESLFLMSSIQLLMKR